MKIKTDVIRTQIIVQSVLTVLMLLSLSFGLVGCGGHYKDNVSAPASSSGSSNGGNYSSNTNTSTSTSTDIATRPAYTYTFQITGSNGKIHNFTTPDDVVTDSILQVKVIAGAAGRLTVPGYSNWSMSYGCVQYKVTVNGQSRMTKVLKVPGTTSAQCANADTSETMEFSSRLGGPGPVSIQISEPRYDFYCQLWYQSYALGYDPTYIAGYFNSVCPLKLTYKTHTIGGSVEVRVNGTQFSPN